MNPAMTAAEVLAQQLDQRARREALDAGRSMLLQAPAGSGKTTVLTARFLALLARVEQPEQIIAITFTRKAAAEMRRRVLSALQAAHDGSAVTGIASELLQAAHQRDAQRGWMLLQNPSRLRIETIDALNHWLATQLPVSARSGPTLEIAAAPAVLYRRAARRCLQGATEEPAVAAAVERLFDRLDNDWGKVEQLLAEMLGQRSHWLPRVLRAPDGELLRRVEDSLQSVLRAELARLVAAIPAALLREAEQLLDYARRQRRGAQAAEAHSPVQLSAQPESLPHWQALCALTLTGEQEWRRSFTVKEGFPPTDRPMKERVQLWLQRLAAVPGSQPLCRGLRDLPAGRLEPADREALEALALLLTRAAAELQLVFAAAAGVDYPYVAGAARAALSEQGAPTEFALRAGGALRHILVDEFQDTSVEQIELLQALTAGWAAGDGRTLFVVGDPMQSIYQFREAEVGLFLQARDRGIGEIRFESLELRHNFRSTPSLMRWVNEHFTQLFPAHNDARLAAISYLPSLPPPRAADDGDSGARLHRLPPDDPLAEAERVVQIVRATRAAEPQASIAILVASREHAQLPAARLRAAGFTLRGVDLERLRDRPVVRDLSALTRALLHPADRTAWLALLRAPWCALTLSEMDAALVATGADLFDALKRVAAEPPGSSSQRRIERLCAALAPAIDGPERGLPLWRRVEHCWLRLAGPAVHRSDVDRIDAQRFLDALALHADPQRLTGEGIGELTDRLWSAAPAQQGAIELMTMHAAKGLEWDVVILPGLHRRLQTGPDPLLHWIDLPRPGHGTDLLLAPIRSSAEDSRGASLANYIKLLRRERARLERVRLLYVAATRARRQLHLLGEAVDAPISGSLLAVLWPAVAEEFLSLPVAAAPPSLHAPTAPPLSQLWRLPADWSLPAPPAAAASAVAARRLRLGSPESGDIPEYRWVGNTARAVGTIVHAELLRLATAATGTRQRPAGDYQTWLAELGVPAAERPGAAERVAQAVRFTLDDLKGRWLLASVDPDAHSEWRLTGLHGGRVVNVVIDRLLTDPQGERWIVDYKTSTHEGGDVRAFLDSEVQRHRAQLHRYAALVGARAGRVPRLALYFPLLREFREIEAGVD